jgi:2-C-methyl-D-erythritol 2,4-cyclodiphosphate synthase
MMRIGQGFDVHAFAENRRLILAGVEIPYERGLLGHSDADVALHALIDALLGAAALGDIGMLFPDTDQKYKDMDSRVLLRKALELVHNAGYTIANADLTIMAERPKLSPYKDAMRAVIAADLQSELSQISVKATTTEKLGFIGRQEGIACSAIVLLVNQPSTPYANL